MARQSDGKSKREFVQRVLQEDPRADWTEVNRAWTRSRNQGTISRSTVARVRSELGLSARTRNAQPSRTVASRPAPAEPPSGAPGRKNGRSAAQVPAPDRGRQIDELERDLDRILFRAMDLGDMPGFEREIRRCRRLLILGD